MSVNYYFTLNKTKIVMKKSKVNLIASFVLASAFGVFLGISPLTSFAEENSSSELWDIAYCLHNVNGDSGLANFCDVSRCAMVTGQGSIHGACGTSGGGGGPIR